VCSLTAWISLPVTKATPNYQCVHHVPWWTGWISVKANKSDPRRGFISSVWWRKCQGITDIIQRQRDTRSDTTFPSSGPLKVWWDCNEALLCLLFGLLCFCWPKKATRSLISGAETLKEIYRPRGKTHCSEDALFRLVEFSIICHSLKIH